MPMRDMNKAITHPSRHRKSIKKAVRVLHTHNMSTRKLSIKKWSRYNASGRLLSHDP